MAGQKRNCQRDRRSIPCMARRLYQSAGVPAAGRSSSPGGLAGGDGPMHRVFWAAPCVLLLTLNLAPAWWVKGHESIAEAAAAGLPDEMPAFFRAGGKQLAHGSGDPD